MYANITMANNKLSEARLFVVVVYKAVVLLMLCCW